MTPPQCHFLAVLTDTFRFIRLLRLLLNESDEQIWRLIMSWPPLPLLSALIMGEADFSSWNKGWCLFLCRLFIPGMFLLVRTLAFDLADVCLGKSVQKKESERECLLSSSITHTLFTIECFSPEPGTM